MATTQLSNEEIKNIDIGGAEVYVGTRYLGLTRGDCTASFSTENVEVWKGVPRQKIGTIIRQRNGNVTMEVLELTPENYSLASGDGRVINQTTNETKTVTGEIIFLEATAATELEKANIVGSSIVVKDMTGDTTYVADTDYTVATTADGMTTIARIATGSIPDGTAVSVSYSYTRRRVKTQLLSGSSSAPNEIRNLVFHKYNDRNQRHLILQIWRLQSSGSLDFVYNEEASDVLGINLNLGVNSDTQNHPSCPLFLATWDDEFDIEDLPTPLA